MTFSGTASRTSRPFPPEVTARSAAETKAWGWFIQ
jgi:hypothetical protein